MNTIDHTISNDLSSLLPPSDNHNNTKGNFRTKPLWHFKEHKAAVKVNFNTSFFPSLSLLIFFLKALAWCPWEGSKVLATGGGHNDGYLRFWNNSNGACQQAIKTESQVYLKND